MIKGNESDVGNIDFELQTQRGDKFLCFSLFLNFKECSYLRNQMSDYEGFGSKCSILNVQVISVKNLKLNIADMWLIPLDHVTYIFELWLISKKI